MRRLLRILLVQAAVQPVGLFLLTLSALVTLPFGWVYAFFQNMTALGEPDDGKAGTLAREAWRQARLWPAQNHSVLLVLFCFGLFVFFNWLSVGLLLSPLFLPGIVKQRILYTFNQPEEPGQITIGELRLDTSTSARLQSWQEAVRDFTKHPFLGYGVTGYASIDAQFPRVLTETGLLGLSAFIYLLVSVFRMALQRLRETAR